MAKRYKLKSLDDFKNVKIITQEEKEILNNEGLEFMKFVSYDTQDGKETVKIVREIKNGYDNFFREDLEYWLKKYLEPEDYKYFKSLSDKGLMVSVTKAKLKYAIDNVKKFLNLKGLFTYHHYTEEDRPELYLKRSDKSKTIYFSKFTPEEIAIKIKEKLKEIKQYEETDLTRFI